MVKDTSLTDGANSAAALVDGGQPAVVGDLLHHVDMGQHPARVQCPMGGDLAGRGGRRDCPGGVRAFGMLVYVKGNALVDDRARQLSYGVATIVPALCFVGMWLLADRLRFDILLPGLAWRTYFVLTTLPAALAVWGRKRE